MQLEGNIRKMRTELANPIKYSLPIGENLLEMNDLIGKEISMKFDGQINCVSCGKQTKTSFGQGYCYNCLQTAPETSESVLRPELSKSQFGIARDMEWAEKHDLIDHVVYLAVTTEIKVGVTRIHQVPTRWIDQGASAAIKLVTTPNRHIAGIIEVFLKKHFTDKTNWRAMLMCETALVCNLLDEKAKVIELLPAELRKYAEPDNSIVDIHYPVHQYPDKIKSINFDKMPIIRGTLSGIKGQYLIFEDHTVLNMRRHNGYYLQVKSPS